MGLGLLGSRLGQALEPMMIVAVTEVGGKIYVHSCIEMRVFTFLLCKVWLSSSMV